MGDPGPGPCPAGSGREPWSSWNKPHRPRSEASPAGALPGGLPISVVIWEQTSPGLALTGVPTQIPNGDPEPEAVVILEQTPDHRLSGNTLGSAPCGTLPCPAYPRTTSHGCRGVPGSSESLSADRPGPSEFRGHPGTNQA